MNIFVFLSRVLKWIYGYEAILYKYSIKGDDATFLLNKLITRNLLICKIGQVLYTPWCDENGKVIDDGTVQKLAENDSFPRKEF